MFRSPGRISSRSRPTFAMVRLAFNRADAGMDTPRKKDDESVSASPAATAELEASDEDLEAKDSVILTRDVQAVRMHQLAISLRPLAGSTGRPMLTASRWEVRKAIMSLCRTPPTMFEVRYRVRNLRQFHTRPAVARFPQQPSLAAAAGTRGS